MEKQIINKNLELANELVNKENLNKRSKAFLLYKLCELTSIYSPELLNDYWQKLIPIV